MEIVCLGYAPRCSYGCLWSVQFVVMSFHICCCLSLGVSVLVSKNNNNGHNVTNYKYNVVQRGQLAERERGHWLDREQEALLLAPRELFDTLCFTIRQRAQQAVAA